MKTILLVDDIELNRKFILPTFQNDFFVLEAGNGIDALTILKSNHVDLVITDIIMDGMDGYTLIKEIRKREELKDLPIIAITEKDDVSQADAIAAGANYFVSRPMNSDELRKETYKLTGQDRGRKELIHTDFLLQSIPGAVIVYKLIDNDLVVLTCSRGISTITGWDAEEICENSPAAKYNKIHPADTDVFRAMIHKIVYTKSRSELIFRGYKKDGSIIWLFFQGHYVGVEDGCPIIEGLILDVSNNSNMYQSILDLTSALITVVDATTFEVLYANQTAKETVEDHPCTYIGNTCYKYVFGFNKPCPHCIVNNSKKDTYLIPEQEYKGHYYRQIFKRMTWHGRDAIMEFTTDITEEKERLNLIEQQQDLQSSILDTIPAGIMAFKFIDDEIHIVAVNKSICEMMGMDKEKALGEAKMNITALTHPDDIHIVLDAAKKLSVEDAYIEYEYRHFYCSRNDYVWVLAQGRSIRNADGYVYAYVNYTDITARKKVEKLESQLEHAEIQAATKAEFFSQMSHDMRTPMNIVLGLAEIASKETDLDKIHQDIRKIQDSGRYMLDLINDTLDLQRMEGGQLQLDPKVINCSHLYEDIISMVTPNIQKKKVTLNISILKNSRADCYVMVDTFRMKQIILNVLSNAIKFTPSGGTIDFEVQELKREGAISHRMIRVSDTGVGMSEDFLKHKIFTPFSQESNGLSMNYPGSGLGLSIVKQLVDLMHGRIEVESTLGVGTTFKIYLDTEIVPDEEAEQLEYSTLSKSKKIEESLDGKRILLCEDHPVNAEIVQRLLEKVGCNVDWAENGKRGIEMFEASDSGYYQSILMDIRMPIIDGLTAAKFIRGSDHPDATSIPIIAMSANAYEDDIKKSLQVGMNAHVAKPVKPEKMFQILEEHMNN